MTKDSNEKPNHGPTYERQESDSLLSQSSDIDSHFIDRRELAIEEDNNEGIESTKATQTNYDGSETLDTNELLGKVQYLNELQKLLYQDEIARRTDVDSKAERYLTILVALVGASAFALSRMSRQMFPEALEFYLLITGIVFFFLLSIGALLACLSAINVRKYTAFSVNTEIRDYIISKPQLAGLFHMSEEMRLATMETRRQNDARYKRLRFSAGCLTGAIVVGVLIGAILFFKGVLVQ